MPIMKPPYSHSSSSSFQALADPLIVSCQEKDSSHVSRKVLSKIKSDKRIHSCFIRRNYVMLYQICRVVDIYSNYLRVEFIKSANEEERRETRKFMSLWSVESFVLVKCSHFIFSVIIFQQD